MPDRPPRPHVAALRACALNRGGMRISAHAKAMSALEEIGYVEKRAPRGRPDEMRWFLTQPGRDLLKALGSGEAE